MSSDANFKRWDVTSQEIPVCPACHSKYVIKAYTSFQQRSERTSAVSPPLILHCGHSICGSCAKKSLLVQGNVPCSKCEAVTRVTRINQLPRNHYLIGLIHNHQFFANKSSARSFNINLKMVPRFNLGSPNTIICEICKKSAHVTCGECDAPFCGQCFMEFHSTSEFNHTSKALISYRYRTKTNPLHMCKVLGHEDKPLTYFCKGDNQSVCGDCVISTHKGHDCILVSVKLEELNDELKESLATLQATADCLKYSGKTMGDLNEGGNVADNKCVTEIREHFNHLHGMLQLRESRLINQVMDNGDKRVTLMNNMLKKIEEYQEKVYSLISELKECLKCGHTKSCDIVSLYSRLERVKKLPCYLTPCNSNIFFSSFSPATVNWQTVEAVNIEEIADFPTLVPLEDADDDVLQTLSEANSMERVPELELLASRSNESIESFGLMPRTSDLSNGAAEFLGSDEAGIGPKIKHRSNWVGHEQSLAQRKASNQDVPTCQDPAKAFINAINAVRVELVRVIHIETPASFYVQRKSDLADFDDMCTKLNLLSETELIKASKIQKKKIYLVRFNQSEWRRARVTIVNADSSQGREFFTIFYIDFGTTVAMRFACIYNMPDEFCEYECFTIHCSLHGIEPLNKMGDWSPESINQFKKFTNAEEVNMRLIETDCPEAVLKVDIGHANPKSNLENPTPFSVRTALVCLNLASYSCPENECDDNDDLSQSVLNACSFHPPYSPPVGERFPAQLSFITSPSDFYVQMMGENLKPLEGLIYEMQLYYASFKPTAVFCNRFLGLPCVVKYSVDGKFYRAKIMDAPEKSKVRVFYVDFGNIDDVECMNILPIHPKFMRFPELAIHCSLVDVSLPDGHAEWPDEAIEFIKASLHGKNLSIHVEAKTDEKQVVSINFLNDSNYVNLNACLVHEGYANSIGPCSQPLLLGPRLSFVSNHDADSKPLRNDKGKALFQTKVIVVNIESPTSIYVQLHKDQDQISALKGELYAMYNKSLPPADVDWEVGAKCVMKSPIDKGWYRAVIKDTMVEDGCAFKVFLIDYGQLFAIGASLLREIGPSHAKLDAFARHCHLFGIAEPGDSGRWPNISTECLIAKMEKYNKIVYLNEVGDTENEDRPKSRDQSDSFAVDLVYKSVKVPGPLDPAITQYKSLTDLLLKKGLALPTNSLPWKQRRLSKRVGNYHMNRDNEEGAQDNNTDEEVCYPSNNFFPFEKYAANDSFDSSNIKLGSDYDVPELSSMQQWMPAVVPRQAGYRFQAIPTYVADDGCLFMHFAEESAYMLKIIGDFLHYKYEDSESESRDYYWIPQQACIAKYTDGKWYRGIILKINSSDPKPYLVEFIDYGNMARLGVADVRKQLLMVDHPRLSFKCRLFDVAPNSPDGQWTAKQLDLFQQMVAGQMCWVTIMNPGDEDTPPAVVLKVLKDTTVNDMVVTNGVALKTGEAAVSEDSATSIPFPETSLEDNYAEDATMTVGALKVAVISQIISPTLICVRVDSKEVKKSAKMRKNYEKIMAKEADGWPRVVNPILRSPCCAKYKDINWCRATIRSVDKEQQLCTVLFVDKGIEESLHFDKLRRLPVELLKCPKRAFYCELFQLEPTDGEWTETLSNKLRDQLKSQPKWIIEIKECGDPVSIELLIREKGKPNKLAYQELIDSNDLKLVRKKNPEEML